MREAIHQQLELSGLSELADNTLTRAAGIMDPLQQLRLGAAQNQQHNTIQIPDIMHTWGRTRAAPLPVVVVHKDHGRV